MKQMVLQDGSTIDLIEASYPEHYVMACRSAKTFKTAWNKLTEDNISVIKVLSDGIEEAVIVGSQMAGTQTVNVSADELIGHFYLKEGYVYTPEEWQAEQEDTGEGLPVA